jgi:hypothetical protein
VAVVDRQRPADAFDPPVAADERIGHDAQGGQRHLGRALHELSALQRARREGFYAALGIVPRHLGHLVHHFGELRAAEIPVQDRHVVGVEHVLVMLQPVARRHDVAAGADARVVGVKELAVIEDLQFQGVLKLRDRLRRFSLLLISPAQKATIDPVSLVKINGTAQLFDCAVPLAGKDGKRSRGKAPD